MADDLIDEIVKHPEKLKLGGEIKSTSVLFCDLANFTDISENRSPHEIVEIMSSYFEDMTKFVFEFNGTLKEYVGDELMALFGAPLPQDGHAVDACKAALAMQAYLKDRREDQKQSRRPPLSARVGVNSGEMLVGNLGSKYRFSYGVMGDNVNLASRLEGLNKIYGTKIIIGQNTARLVKDDFILRKLGAIRVKGRLTPEIVFELVGDNEDILADKHKFALDCYKSGYKHYENQQWSKAIADFEKGHHAWSKDKSCEVMIQRCGMYKRLPYIEKFDGVFVERRK